MSKSNEELMQENTELKEEVAELKRQLSVLKKMAFGSKSEKTKQVETNPEQISLFNEAETEQSVSAREEEKEIVVTGHSRKKKRTRDEIFKTILDYVLFFGSCGVILGLPTSIHITNCTK